MYLVIRSARMDFGLRDKAAIVAAASKGLGKGVARPLAREGAHIVIVSRDLASISAAAADVQAAAQQGSQVAAIAADVTVLADLERVVRTAQDRFGGADILFFNNAGGPKPGMFDSLENDDWYNAVDLNLLSAIRLTRLCLPFMRGKKWCPVISSTSSSVKQPLPTLMLSDAVRTATTAWSKTLADQIADDVHHRQLPGARPNRYRAHSTDRRRPGPAPGSHAAGSGASRAGHDSAPPLRSA